MGAARDGEAGRRARGRPTGADGFLVTEAVRGEGARLLDAAGERFVDELAPRDEVARAVQREIESSRSRAVGLDMRDVDPALFPNVVSALRRAGIDPERELIPVAPAAHYMMGGIATDLDGRATAARPVRGRRVLVHRPARRQPARVQLAQRVLRVRRPRGPRGAGRARRSRRWHGPRPPPQPPRQSIAAASREALWRYAGLERDADGLRALSGDAHPLVRLIATSALAREESRGAHLRTDFPERDPALDGVHIGQRDVDDRRRTSVWP